MVSFFKNRQHPDDSILKGYLTGQILLASPYMEDARFLESVIYICGHDNMGAMGFMINRPLPSVSFNDLLDQLSIEHENEGIIFPIFYGGPVEMGRGFVLHSAEYNHPSTVKINNDFSITATLEILKEIAEKAGPQKSLLALGYTGWTEGQLEQEIQKNQWFILKGSKNFVYDTPPNLMWENAFKELGFDPRLVAMDTGKA